MNSNGSVFCIIKLFPVSVHCCYCYIFFSYFAALQGTGPGPSETMYGNNNNKAVGNIFLLLNK